MKIHKIVVGELATNCYIVESQKKNGFVIDPGDNAPMIRDFLDQHKIEARFIVNTHGHIDHIKADADLGFPVYIHEDDSRMVESPNSNPMSVFFGTFQSFIPQRLLKGGDQVVLDEMTFDVIHTPGHTRGGICLYGHEVLFSGDTLFRDGIGRTDFPGSSYELMQSSLKKLSKLKKDTVVYPGHGPQTTIARELDILEK